MESTIEKKKLGVLALSLGTGPRFDKDRYANGGYTAHQKMFLHGKSNIKIGFIVAEISNNENISPFSQWEVDDLLQGQFSYQRSALPTFRVSLASGRDYIDTLDVLLEIQRLGKEQGVTHFIAVGHRWHLPRIRLTAKAIGLKLIAPDKKYWEKIKAIPFDPNSGQPWTRNFWAWWWSEWPKLLAVRISLDLYKWFRDVKMKK
jgi:hypothetical protein